MTQYVPVETSVPVGGATATNFQLNVPTKGEFQLSTPAKVYESIAEAWAIIVEDHQCGLLDAKHKGPVARMSPVSTGFSYDLLRPTPHGVSCFFPRQGEAWHHHQAMEHGVVDSARFLIVFGLLPSIQVLSLWRVPLVYPVMCSLVSLIRVLFFFVSFWFLRDVCLCCRREERLYI